MKLFYVLLILVLVITLIIGGTIFYFRVFGKNFVEKALSKALDSDIRFESFTLDLPKYTATFTNITLPGKDRVLGAKYNLTANKLVLLFDKGRFQKRRAIIFEKITVKNAVLHIERGEARGGVLPFKIGKNIPFKKGVKGVLGTPKPSAFYSFGNMVKNISIKDSTIEFVDRDILGAPYTIIFDDFNAEITAKPQEKSSGSMPIVCQASFRIPSQNFAPGRVNIDGVITAYKYMEDIQARVNTQSVDITIFGPYINRYTPFIIRQGIFSSRTNFELLNTRINSLTTMEFYTLSLAVDPSKEGASFLNTSVDKLVPYLTSKSGSLIFDFTVKGGEGALTYGLGPQVKDAIGMAITSEIFETIRRFQK